METGIITILLDGLTAECMLSLALKVWIKLFNIVYYYFLLLFHVVFITEFTDEGVWGESEDYEEDVEESER